MFESSCSSMATTCNIAHRTLLHVESFTRALRLHRVSTGARSPYESLEDHAFSQNLVARNSRALPH